MKKIAAMTAIVALVSMPVLAAGQGGYTGPSATTPASSTTRGGGFTGPSGAVTTRHQCQIAAGRYLGDPARQNHRARFRRSV